MNKKETGDFVFEYNNKEYEVQWEGTWTLDRFYGADIDGNRGTQVWIEDDLSFFVYDNKGKEVTDNYIQVKAEKLIQDEIENLNFTRL